MATHARRPTAVETARQPQQVDHAGNEPADLVRCWFSGGIAWE